MIFIKSFLKSPFSSLFGLINWYYSVQQIFALGNSSFIFLAVLMAFLSLIKPQFYIIFISIFFFLKPFAVQNSICFQQLYIHFQQFISAFRYLKLLIFSKQSFPIFITLRQSNCLSLSITIYLVFHFLNIPYELFCYLCFLLVPSITKLSAYARCAWIFNKLHLLFLVGTFLTTSFKSKLKTVQSISLI